HQRLRREWIELLDAHDLHAEIASAVARFHQLVSKLPRAEHEPASLTFGRRIEVADNATEVTVASEVADLRYRQPMPKQRLRSHHHQRLAEVPPHLPPKDVEVIRRRRAVCDLHIVLGTKLQVTLQPRRAVLRSLPFKSMRKKHDEAARAQPLCLAGGNELVDDALGAIGEIAELRLPQHQRLRVGQRIAVFEPEHAELRKRAIANFKAGTVHLAERNIFLAILLVDPHRVPLAEGASPTVLARQTHAVAFGEQASKRQCFGGCPVEPLAAPEHLLLGVEHALQGLVDREAFGNGREDLAQTPDFLFADRSLDVPAAKHWFVGTAE